MNKLPAYVIYLAVMVRMAAWFEKNPPPQTAVIVLMLAFGIVLLVEPRITRLAPRFPYGYLVIQTAIVAALLFINKQDFLPSLFLSLSFQAVQFFKRRLGFLWIGLFTIATASPLMIGWNWQVAGLVMVLFFSFLYFMMGTYADLTLSAQAKSQENQIMLGELQKAYRQLQEYAAQAEELVAAQERHRLARELHDSVTQTLFSMNLTVQAARMAEEKGPARVIEHLERLQKLAQGAAGEIQVLSSRLRPRSISEIGLTSALELLVNERAARDGLEIKLEVKGERDLPEPIAVGLYRIAQESLNNISKHAGTCQAVLRLDFETVPAHLEVEDNGRGFDLGKISQSMGHIGLAGMAERARELDWKLTVDSQPGRGTRIRVEENEHVPQAQL
jgi:signal transduction histidine kinase